MENFVKKDIYSLSDNLFKLLNNDWMLITAGNIQNYNMMTASWGTFGIMWNNPVAICLIRPQRYTRKFAEENDFFTLSFFPEKYRTILNLCGSTSGRDIDKMKISGLTPVATDKGNITFLQTGLFFECKKLYSDDIKQDKFILPEIIRQNYIAKDFHRFYIGEIINCYQNSIN